MLLCQGVGYCYKKNLYISIIGFKSIVSQLKPIHESAGITYTNYVQVREKLQKINGWMINSL